MEKTALVLMSAGILLFVAAGADLVSIVLSIIETIVSLDLHAAYFGSFFFRALLVLAGGAALLVGGILYKKADQMMP